MTTDDADKPAEAFAGLIDPPFGHGLEAWLRFKVEMENQPLTADVQDFIDEANREIEALGRGRPRWMPPTEAGNT